MSTTTQQELAGALRGAIRSAADCGLSVEGWHLQGGSKVNGVQFAFVTDRAAVKIGFTKTEAWSALRAMDVAWRMVADAKRRPAEVR